MEKSKQPLFKYLDCIRLYVPDLEEGIKYYCDGMGLKIIWKSDSQIGLGMSEGKTEIVIQNESDEEEIDIKVDSVIKALPQIKKAGGQVISGPFDIKIGKCAAIKDPWNNKYIILDSSKGLFITDDEGNIIGQKLPSD